MKIFLKWKFKRTLTLADDNLFMPRKSNMNCVVEPFTVSVKNTIPPVKKTNYTIKTRQSDI